MAVCLFAVTFPNDTSCLFRDPDRFLPFAAPRWPSVLPVPSSSPSALFLMAVLPASLPPPAAGRTPRHFSVCGTSLPHAGLIAGCLCPHLFLPILLETCAAFCIPCLLLFFFQAPLEPACPHWANRDVPPRYFPEHMFRSV